MTDALTKEALLAGAGYRPSQTKEPSRRALARAFPDGSHARELALEQVIDKLVAENVALLELVKVDDAVPE